MIPDGAPRGSVPAHSRRREGRGAAGRGRRRAAARCRHAVLRRRRREPRHGPADRLGPRPRRHQVSASRASPPTPSTGSSRTRPTRITWHSAVWSPTIRTAARSWSRCCCRRGARQVELGDSRDPRRRRAGPHRRPAAGPGTPRRRSAGWPTTPLRSKRRGSTLFTQNTTNLTSPRYGGYFYDATKALALGLAYLDD